MKIKAIALMIDGENISPIFADEILHKTMNLGLVAVRQVFGDFYRTNTPPWKCPIVKALGYDLVHVRRAYRGSNSADYALCQQARRLLGSGIAKAICIVSCDSDFSRLAQELTSDGIPCYAMGTASAAKRLQSSSTQFLCLGEESPTIGPLRRRHLRMLRVAITANANKHGWAKLQAVDRYLKHNSTLYHQNRWGFVSIAELIRSTNQFELEDFPGNHRRIRPRG